MTLFDGPSMTVRDVRDFFRPESAQRRRRRRLADRPLLADLRRPLREAAGGAVQQGRGVEGVAEHRRADRLLRPGADAAQPGPDEGPDRGARVLDGRARDHRRQPQGRPLRHPEPLPARPEAVRVCSAMPDAFQMDGISVVEALAQLQQMLWTIQNQRIDNLRLAGNLITLIRSDVDDPDSVRVPSGRPVDRRGPRPGHHPAGRPEPRQHDDPDASS